MTNYTRNILNITLHYPLSIECSYYGVLGLQIGPSLKIYLFAMLLPINFSLGRKVGLFFFFFFLEIQHNFMTFLLSLLEVYKCCL